jgi:hypothetical protein
LFFKAACFLEKFSTPEFKIRSQAIHLISIGFSNILEKPKPISQPEYAFIEYHNCYKAPPMNCIHH